jgi:signal transduction histidine kinase
MNTKLIIKLEKVFLKLTKYYWVVIGLVLIVLAGMETAEFSFGISDTFHLSEILIYVALLGLVGLLVEMVLRANRAQQNTMNVLKYKHNFSLELLPFQNWDSLVALLVKRLAEIVDAREAYLSVREPLSQDFKQIAEWVDDGYTKCPPPTIPCQVCIENKTSDKLSPAKCEFQAKPNALIDSSSYCIPILYKGSPYALIRFNLNAGQTVTDEQKQILINLSDEIIIALMAGRDRKRLSELELAEATLAERHSVSHYLHDNLGQNLGYLRMKLEQFSNQPFLKKKDDDFRAELKQMKDIADQSYQIVRNKLEICMPDSTPMLTNFLQEHAKKVTQRSKIEIKFTSHGISKPVPVELQRAVFYVFQEALSNVEKHAQATSVDVVLNWDKDNLKINVADNGTGFNIFQVSRDKHFGLQIMQERISAAGGIIEFNSSETSGTSIEINAPIIPQKFNILT